MQTPFLSVVIPSYNEILNLQRNVLDEVVMYLKKQTYSWEIVLSDDGSTDGTASALVEFAKKHPNIRVLKNHHAGKAPTVTAGMLAAKGKWRLFTDFDQSTPLAEIKKLLKFTDRYDIIIGSREIDGALRDKEPLHRHVMGKGFNFIVQLITVRGIYDTQCGFKLFSAESADVLFRLLHVYGTDQVRSDPFTGAFDVELLFVAQKRGLSIKEIPIAWRHNPTERVSPIKDSLRMLRDVLKIRMADINGKYQNQPK